MRLSRNRPHLEGVALACAAQQGDGSIHRSRHPVAIPRPIHSFGRALANPVYFILDVRCGSCGQVLPEQAEARTKPEESMFSKPETSTRRVFLKSSLGFGPALLGGLGCGSDPQVAPAGTAAGAKSKVVIARDERLRPGNANPGQDGILKILDRALQAFYGQENPGEAWKQVARPGEVIGLKVNCLAGRGISTHPQLVEAICERLQQAGFRAIVIWDRLNADLESAGFKIADGRSAVRCYGNDTAGYEQELEVFGNVGSLLSTTLTRTCDAVINLPVLKDHGITGITGALKNMFGAIHNPNKYHLTVGDPYVADVNMLPPIRRKVRLTICDAITAQYEGGPSFMPQWAWPFNGLIVGRDPVALDYTCWQIIEQKRAERGLEPLQRLKRAPGYIATAADPRHQLGTCDPGRIQVVTL
jgi:uncharacterized protein (DUF362 family)